MGGDVSNLSFEFSHAVGDGVDILAGVGVVQIGLQVRHGLLLVAQRGVGQAPVAVLGPGVGLAVFSSSNGIRLGASCLVGHHIRVSDRWCHHRLL